MPEFKCLKNVCDPVKAKDEQTARSSFRCDDCSFFPKSCAGLGQIDQRRKSLDEKIDIFFAELARTPAKKGLRSTAPDIVAKYREEIQKVLDQGHGFLAIAKGLRALGMRITDKSLKTAFYDIEAPAKKAKAGGPARTA